MFSTIVSDPWPAPAPDVHVHLSPPCTSLSKARTGGAPAQSVAAALDATRGSQGELAKDVIEHGPLMTPEEATAQQQEEIKARAKLRKEVEALKLEINMLRRKIRSQVDNNTAIFKVYI